MLDIKVRLKVKEHAKTPQTLAGLGHSINNNHAEAVCNYRVEFPDRTKLLKGAFDEVVLSFSEDDYSDTKVCQVIRSFEHWDSFMDKAELFGGKSECDQISISSGASII